MKKKNFAMLLLGTVGGVLMGLGMCMCLLPEWNAFTTGAYCTGIGFVILLALLGVGLRGKKIRWKTAGKVAFGVAGTLVFGVGMCMIMVWEVMLPGVLVGIVGIVMLQCLIPMFLGLK